MCVKRFGIQLVMDSPTAALGELTRLGILMLLLRRANPSMLLAASGMQITSKPSRSADPRALVRNTTYCFLHNAIYFVPNFTFVSILLIREVIVMCVLIFCLSVCLSVCLSICLHACIHKHTCTCMNVCTFVCLLFWLIACPLNLYQNHVSFAHTYSTLQ